LALFSLLALSIVASAQLGRQSGLLDPNVGTEQQLAALPHMNATLAKSIIDGRPFLSMTDLNALLSKSLSKEQLAELYGKLFLHANLNTAPEAEIMLIPGMGPRMAHEFEEYRPYRSLDQFRREIGKYVNEQEVARLEQYIFIPLNLNTASDADLMTIPGLGSRMLHEFKEYRPYRNIEQFRREIGKYVNEKEVARLERYVALD
jgi:DNA uptake protein ComE-like DNA-binding protein